MKETEKITGRQKAFILNYLIKGNTLTTYKAMRHFGIMSLATRISELIHHNNVPIKKRTIRNGAGKVVKQYSL